MDILNALLNTISINRSQANNFAYNTVSFRAHYAKQTYNVADLLAEIFSFTSYCLLFHAFYAIVHVFADRVTKMNYRTLSVLKYVHWGVVAFFVLLCIADWGYYVAVVDSKVKASSSYAHRYDVWVKIDSARWVVNWISAWEIAGWAIFLGLMTSRDSVYIKYKVSDGN